MPKNIYVEPIDFFPESVRKSVGIGEYAEDEEQEEKKREVNEQIRKFVNKKK